MPYKKISELPKNVQGLPSAAQKMWMSVFNSAYSGTCKDKEDKDKCAAKIAWSQVSKKYGTKSDGVAEFSLAVTAATHNKSAGTLRWKASASDVFDDSYQDNMTAELFNDFMSRIESGEQVPERYRSDFWQGGMPYLSVAHYDDLDGDGVPGDVEKIYMDGNYLKSCGEFRKTPLGLACYHSLCKDLYEEEKSDKNDNIRISIAFLDWKHRHKDDGTIFERKSLDDICPKCLMEMITGEYSGKEFLRGQLIHLALTRSPVNKRTSINLEVDKSMTTQKEDAASIIGEELADELESKKSELETKSQAEVRMSEAEDKEKDEEEMEEEKDKKEKKPAKKKAETVEEIEVETETVERDVLAELDEVKGILSQLAGQPEEVEPVVETESETEGHPLDQVFDSFKSAYDEVMKSELSADDKLRALQEPLDTVSRSLIDTVRGVETKSEVEPEGEMQSVLRSLTDAISNLNGKMDLVLDSRTVQPNQAVIPERRSIYADQQVRQNLQKSTRPASKVEKSTTPKLRELVERSVGIVG